jgi:hypothetical protein
MRVRGVVAVVLVGANVRWGDAVVWQSEAKGSFVNNGAMEGGRMWGGKRDALTRL